MEQNTPDSDDEASLKINTLITINQLGQKTIKNPYANKNPFEDLPSNERLRLNQRFSLIDTKINVIQQKEESEYEDQQEPDQILSSPLLKDQSFESKEESFSDSENEKILKKALQEQEQRKNIIRQNSQKKSKRMTVNLMNEHLFDKGYEKTLQVEDEGQETPRTKMVRLFYQKYKINPMNTMKTMKQLKNSNIKMEIKSQVGKDIVAFEDFFKRCSILVQLQNQGNSKRQNSTQSQHLTKDEKNALLKKNQDMFSVYSKESDQVSSQYMKRSASYRKQNKELINNFKSEEYDGYLESLPLLKETQDSNDSFTKEAIKINLLQKLNQSPSQSKYEGTLHLGVKSKSMLDLQGQFQKKYFFKASLHDQQKQKKLLQQEFPQKIAEHIMLTNKVLINKKSFQNKIQQHRDKLKSSVGIKSRKMSLATMTSFRPTLFLPNRQSKYGSMKDLHGYESQKENTQFYTPRGSIIEDQINQHKETEQKTMNIIKECLKNEKNFQLHTDKLELQRLKMREYYQDLNQIFHLINEEDFVYSKKKKTGEIFDEYKKTKEEFAFGKKLQSGLEEYVQQELNEFKNKKNCSAMLYDALIQKYSSTFNLSNKKKKARYLHVM